MVTWTAMITGYSQNDRPEDALALFPRLKPNHFTFSSVFKASVTVGKGKDMQEAIHMFWRMQREDFKPTHYTYASVYSACASIGALEQGKWVHAHMIKSRGIGNTLLDMYAKAGSIEDASLKRTNPKKMASSFNIGYILVPFFTFVLLVLIFACISRKNNHGGGGGHGGGGHDGGGHDGGGGGGEGDDAESGGGGWDGGGGGGGCDGGGGGGMGGGGGGGDGGGGGMGGGGGGGF
ncbi:hypothetical protein GIB67_039997 [Kingdonia uniflora]|uniref:Pentatricopeptide repeat-containing protein n=1 Tax=Kingdonia uniflora TaxID=39325 RepID=A0A7J7LIF1_9MAGN|nr:hypothetical protein GIB67_039997 [Kingdonia uniflora]